MKIELEIHDDILTLKNLTEYDIKMYIAVALYNNKIISTGKLAQILSLDRYEIIENMGKYGGNFIDGKIEDYIVEYENAKNH